MPQFFFIVFSAIAVWSALQILCTRNLIHGILWLVVTFFSTACLFVLLRAEFLAAMQILVYAGAIVILYVFAVMLVNLKTSPEELQFHKQKRWGYVIGGLIFAELGFIISTRIKSLALNQGLAGSVQQLGGGAKALGQILYTDYVLPFEIISIILLVAIIGAVVLIARRPQ